jgi:hypothetical protein
VLLTTYLCKELHFSREDWVLNFGFKTQAETAASRIIRHEAEIVLVEKFLFDAGVDVVDRLIPLKLGLLVDTSLSQRTVLGEGAQRQPHVSFRKRNTESAVGGLPP